MTSPSEVNIVANRLKLIDDRLQKIEQQRVSLQAEEDALRTQRVGVASWLEELRSQVASETTNGRGTHPDREVAYQFRGLTQRQALHLVGRMIGPDVRVIDAVEVLLEANFSDDRERTRDMVFNVLHRGVKNGEWERLDAGLYRQVHDPYKPNEHRVNGNGHQPVPAATADKTSEPTVYCRYCKTHRTFRNPVELTMSNGQYRTKAECNECGREVSRFGRVPTN